MKAAKVNLDIDQYASFYRGFVCKDSAGHPVDLSGFSAAIEFKNEKYDKTPMLRYVTSANLANTDQLSIQASDGRVVLFLSRYITADLPFKTAYFDILLYKGDSIVFRLIEGVATVNLGVTQNV